MISCSRFNTRNGLKSQRLAEDALQTFAYFYDPSNLKNNLDFHLIILNNYMCIYRVCNRHIILLC